MISNDIDIEHEDYELLRDFHLISLNSILILILL